MPYVATRLPRYYLHYFRRRYYLAAMLPHYAYYYH